MKLVRRMEHVVAAAGALIGGTVVSVVASGEGATGHITARVRTERRRPSIPPPTHR
ncbi:hypothetical protein [Spongiactinospora sp. 9N601]|uniref:hypothetical protein n=1 Tax=Spongiactinospora sp. 9N601 TaxID=3375149 RepID=UPI00379F5F58